MGFSTWLILGVVIYGGYAFLSKENGYELTSFTCAMTNEGVPTELIDAQLSFPTTKKSFFDKNKIHCTQNMQCHINFQPWEKLQFPSAKIELPFSKEEFYGGPDFDLVAIVSPDHTRVQFRPYRFTSMTSMKFGLESCTSGLTRVDIYPNLQGPLEKVTSKVEGIIAVFKK